MSDQVIQSIHQSLLDELLRKAHAAPRRRAIHRLHNGDWEHCHRMLNALAVGTYVRPHRHGNEHQSEGFIVLRGCLALLIFDDDGQLDSAASYVLSAAGRSLGLDLPPRIWHSLVALEDTVIYEVKGHPAGGYVEARDKDFAPWSPAEGAPEAAAYLRALEQAARLLFA